MFQHHVWKIRGFTTVWVIFFLVDFFHCSLIFYTTLRTSNSDFLADWWLFSSWRPRLGKNNHTTWGIDLFWKKNKHTPKHTFWCFLTAQDLGVLFKVWVRSKIWDTIEDVAIFRVTPYIFVTGEFDFKRTPQGICFGQLRMPMATLKDRGFGLLECENMRRAFGALAENDDERLRSRGLGRIALFFFKDLLSTPQIWGGSWLCTVVNHHQTTIWENTF